MYCQRVRFIGVDGRYDDHMLKRLSKPYSGQTVAMIVDPSTERTFFMQAEFSRWEDFIKATTFIYRSDLCDI